MNTTPTFEKTVDILVKAYLNDNLNRMDCKACAVGNIVAASGVDLVVKDKAYWIYATRKSERDSFDAIEGREEVKATGYTVDELDRIEHAFMEGSSGGGIYSTEYNFEGLMAVVDVLADIHGIDLEKKEAAKLLFVKA